MNEKQRKMMEDFRKMPTEELMEYYSACISARRLANIFGVLSVLVILFNFNILALVIGIPIVLVVANLATNLTDSVKEISAILEKR
jgi:hypothetical protein